MFRGRSRPACLAGHTLASLSRRLGRALDAFRVSEERLPWRLRATVSVSLSANPNLCEDALWVRGFSSLMQVTRLAVLLGSGGCRVTWHTGDLGRDPPGTRFLREQQEGLSSSQVVPSVPSLSPQEARRIPASPRGLQGGTVLYTCPWLKRGPHSQAPGIALRGRRASVLGQNPALQTSVCASCGL